MMRAHFITIAILLGISGIFYFSLAYLEHTWRLIILVAIAGAVATLYGIIYSIIKPPAYRSNEDD